ncbi:hypothetical protein Syun_031896 [Stephania yunnanensis]|uniref:Uncharacterized protein n=1 Tax=Stephania yunnanensis TaxID=152371 RepID=A0AAP0DWX5_9MAGN
MRSAFRREGLERAFQVSPQTSSARGGRSRRGSGFEAIRSRRQTGSGLGPRARPPSQSFSRSYGSILLELPLPTFFHRPEAVHLGDDAVMSTAGRERYSVLRIFKGAGLPDTTTCGALPGHWTTSSGGRFRVGGVLNEKITLPEAPPDVSDSTTLRQPPRPCVHMEPFPLRPSKFSFEYLLLPPDAADGSSPGSRPRFYGYAAPSYSSGLDNCPDGGCGLRASAPSISGLVDSAGELLHTP